MSAQGAVQDFVERLVAVLDGKVSARIDALEARVAALENAKPASTTARAGAAKAAGKSTGA